MYSLRAKILTITLVFLALLGAGFVLYSMATTKNYKRLRMESIEETVAFETEKVNTIIEGIEQGAVSLAREGLLYHKSQSAIIAEIAALEYLRGFPVAAGCGIWFEPYAYNSGTRRAGIYTFFDKERGGVYQDDFNINDYDYHSLNWYREIIGGIKAPYQVAWTRPYTDDTLYSLMTTAGAGIYNEQGDIIGISIIDWEIDGVVEELTAIKPTKNSFVLLCAPEHDYIITDTHTQTEPGASLDSIPWDINAKTFVHDDIRYLTFSRIMDNEWLLSVQIPENEIFAEVENRNNRFSLAIAFSSLLMLCIVYILISKFINRPIKQLTSDVARLAQGNLDIHVTAASNDELGMLAEAVNKMTADLKKYIEDYAHEHAEKERIRVELSVAAEIQANMLPRIFPPFPDRKEFDIYASMIPAKEVGGDFYDFYLLDKNNLAVIIADVSGKGVPAALFMVRARTLIKNIAFCRNSVCCGKSPKDVFETVNNLLCENNDTGMFATAFIGYYNIPGRRFVYANAGHNPPLVKKSGEDYEFIRTKPCLVLGCMENTVYREEEITLGPGDALYLYTDGVTEAMNAGMELFSEQRLRETLDKLKERPLAELLPEIKREIDSFAAGEDQFDDITMLALEITGGPERPDENA
jgi:serine phosphatase RsbU (regulator of sigma subunit)